MEKICKEITGGVWDLLGDLESIIQKWSKKKGIERESQGESSGPAYNLVSNGCLRC